MIPATVRLFGDPVQAETMRGWAMAHLAALKRDMAFQNLMQLKRAYFFPNGAVINMSIAYNLAHIDIYVPFDAGEEGYQEVTVKCWCNCCFAEGIIREVIWHYNQIGFYGENAFPYICTLDDIYIINYNGIRYNVEICQGDSTEIYTCLPSDFAEYAVGDEVIVLHRGNWDGSNLISTSCIGCHACPDDSACNGTRNPQALIGTNIPDGSYLIMPIWIPGINDNGRTRNSERIFS
jgi:hypothetical protein